MTRHRDIDMLLAEATAAAIAASYSRDQVAEALRRHADAIAATAAKCEAALKAIGTYAKMAGRGA